MFYRNCNSTRNSAQNQVIQQICSLKWSTIKPQFFQHQTDAPQHKAERGDADPSRGAAAHGAGGTHGHGRAGTAPPQRPLEGTATLLTFSVVTKLSVKNVPSFAAEKFFWKIYMFYIPSCEDCTENSICSKRSTTQSRGLMTSWRGNWLQYNHSANSIR